MTTNNQTLFDCGSLRVTETYVRTPRETIALDKIDMISVRRPLLFMLLPSALFMIGLWGVFQVDWYPSETTVLLGAAAVFTGLAFSVGELRVHSLSIRDESVFGPIWRLRRARHAIEESVFSKTRVRFVGQCITAPTDQDSHVHPPQENENGA